MSLNFAGLVPHPPIIIPEIGKDDTNKAADTTLAMRKLAHDFGEADIETLIIISPHGLTYPDRFNVSTMPKNFGAFSEFDAPNITFEYASDLELTDQIIEAAEQENIKVVPYDNGGEFYELDHGAMVPLFYLRTAQETSLKIIPISYSWLDRASHFSFGQVIGQVARNYPGRVGILASGDLSHHLLKGSADDMAAGSAFDKKIVDDLKNYKPNDILYYEDDFVERAGECGYRSILILLGALDGMTITPEILSYEGPFGVGYCVANFKLPES